MKAAARSMWLPAPLAPGRAVQAVAQRRVHQRVVARVELDLVDAPAEAVVAVQHGCVGVGQPRMHLHRRAAQPRAEGDEALRVSWSGWWCASASCSGRLPRTG
jgi:hypothetical protein